MKRLERYLAGRLLLGYTTTLSALLFLFGLVDLVDELGDVGEGRYRFLDALLYVSSGLPMRAVELSPVAFLVGGLLGLLPLIQQSEIVAMRACGFGEPMLRRTLSLTGLALGATLWLWLELLAAPAIQWGYTYREARLAKENLHVGRYGLWSRVVPPKRTDLQEPNHPPETIFFHIAPQDGGLGALTLYRFDRRGRLLQFLSARQVVVTRNGVWRLREGRAFRWREGFLIPTDRPPELLKPLLPTEKLEVFTLPAETLSLRELWRQTLLLRRTGQQSALHELHLVDRLLLPLQIWGMALILLPALLVLPRTARRSLMGGVALLFGTAYFLASRVVQNLGLLYDLPAWWVASWPTLLLLLLGWLWNRSRLVSR